MFTGPLSSFIMIYLMVSTRLPATQTLPKRDPRPVSTSFYLPLSQVGADDNLINLDSFLTSHSFFDECICNEQDN